MHIGLAHRRLSIIDLRDVAAQPMIAAEGAIVLVYNGEIYNYLELRSELRESGTVFSTDSDSEVLVAAYLRWGEDCLSRLNGMFAFILWDARKGQALVARDRFGEKPLFYAHTPDGTLALASEAKALFCHPSFPASIDPGALEKFALGGPLIDGDGTLFAGVKRFPAASAAWLQPGAGFRKTWRYWTPAWNEGTDLISPNPRELSEQFKSLLSRSVSMRLRSDVPVGACLSGGLDSSALVGLISSTRDARNFVGTFSARFDADSTISEGPYIDVMSAHTGFPARDCDIDPRELIRDSLRLHWHQETPFLSASIYNEWCVMRAARSAGARVMIDGQGADELLGGYQHYFADFQRSMAANRRILDLTRNTWAFTRRLRREAANYADVRRRFDPKVTARVKELMRLAAFGLPPGTGGDAEAGVPDARASGFVRWRLAKAIQYEMLPNQLLSADRSAMAFGVESRFPFLDHELVDWCLRLPESVLMRDGWLKWILRAATQSILPERIRWRVDKVGYAAPLDVWMRGPLKLWAEERLFDGAQRHLDCFPKELIASYWDRHQRGEDLSWPLWRWISIGEWLRLSAESWWGSEENPVQLPSAASA